MVKVNLEPLLISLLTQMRPPCSSTNFRAKASPSPVAAGRTMLGDYGTPEEIFPVLRTRYPAFASARSRHQHPPRPRAPFPAPRSQAHHAPSPACRIPRWSRRHSHIPSSQGMEASRKPGAVQFGRHVHSKAKIRFQSSFMLTTVQPRWWASSSASSRRPIGETR
jgi:hypothetical protein